MFKKIGLSAAVFGLILASTGSALALTMQELKDVFPGKVLGDAAYTRVSLVANRSLKLGVAPVDIQNGKWNYRVDWSRALNRQGTVLLRKGTARVNGQALSDPAPQIGSAQSGYVLDPNARYNIEFWSKPGASGILLARKYFTTLKASLVACTQEPKYCPDSGSNVYRSGLSCEFAVCPPVHYPDDPALRWIKDKVSGKCVTTDDTTVEHFGTLEACQASTATSIAPSIHTLSPSTGPVGTTVTITGQGFTTGKGVGNNIIFDNLIIAYAVNSLDGKTLQFVVPSSSGPCNNGICGAPSVSYQVSVSNPNGASNSATFTVTACPSAAACDKPFSVISPAGGEQWALGSGHQITWTGAASINSVNILLYYYNAGCQPITNLVSPLVICNSGQMPAPITIAQNVANSGSYSWTIPPTLPAGQFYISVSDAGSSGRSANSNAFSLISATAGAPVIGSLNPPLGPVGSQVIITGSGFTAIGNTVTFAGNPIPNLSSSNGTSLTFTVPDYLNPGCYYSKPACYAPATQTGPGVYQIIVSNANGTSNTANFTVTAVWNASCLPNGYSLDTIVGDDRVTLGSKLTSLNASCPNGQLISGNNKPITFFSRNTCWGNAPYNYQDLLTAEQQQIQALQNQGYEVIIKSCPTDLQ